MKKVFSGAWLATDKALIESLNHLTQLALSKFDIQISTEKMLQEPEYRQLVLSELAQLNNVEMNNIIDWLNSPAKTGAKSAASKPAIYALFSLIIIGFIAFIWLGNNGLTQSMATLTMSEPAKKAIQQSPVSVDKNKVAQPAVQSDVPLVNPPSQATKKTATLLFRLHGSNTIGEKLAPALLEGFLTQEGIDDFQWVAGNNAVERQLHYSKGTSHYIIELHAHGSSTAFADLKSGTADIGMASRRIKPKELNDLQATSGALNQVGNEHIVGLDGLAIIVNQNNPVKKISSKTLAKIFSGEITNWSQLGGVDKKIALYSRDAHSGTWDTFKNLVLKKHKKTLAKTAKRLESSSKLSALVSQNEGAIGFIGLNYVLHNKAIAISAGENTAAIFPTRFTIGTEDYALSRRLYLYTPTSASSLVKRFAQYAISAQGQNIVADTGLISQNIKEEETYPRDDAPQKYRQYIKQGKRLSLNFRFDYATKDLDNKGKRDLERLVKFMEEKPGRRVALLGFSDSIGAKLKNQGLSLKRAKSVELELTSRGIPVIATEGFGEALPIANNDTEAGRKRNRRVEVWLL